MHVFATRTAVPGAGLSVALGTSTPVLARGGEANVRRKVCFLHSVMVCMCARISIIVAVSMIY